MVLRCFGLCSPVDLRCGGHGHVAMAGPVSGCCLAYVEGRLFKLTKCAVEMYKTMEINPFKSHP